MEQPLVWIDLEMTGLDVERDAILEIAVIITDGNLENAIEGPDLVVAASQSQLDGMVPVVKHMHAKSGLSERALAATLTVKEAEQQVLAFVKHHVPEPGVAPLAGNSIHTDRSFLVKHMPKLIDHLHYRIVDVSTIKELARRWMPERLTDAPEKGGGHRALVDIQESIEELRYYRTALFQEPQLPQ
jgi:oligoribonuclease